MWGRDLHDTGFVSNKMGLVRRCLVILIWAGRTNYNTNLFVPNNEDGIRLIRPLAELTTATTNECCSCNVHWPLSHSPTRRFTTKIQHCYKSDFYWRILHPFLSSDQLFFKSSSSCSADTWYFVTLEHLFTVLYIRLLSRW